MNKNSVSVIIPTYNRAHLIKRSIMSVLNQSYSDLELIIVDDGSTDNTETVIKTIEDKRVIYIKQTNQGACAARNNGIAHARGEFIAFQDSDDVWHENKLEQQFETIQKTGADVVFCKMAIDGDKKNVLPNGFREGFLDDDELPLGVSTQTLFAYSKIFREEKFDENIPRLQDFELLLRIQRKYKVYCMENILLDYYVEPDSISRNPHKFLKAWDLIELKHPHLKEIYSKKLCTITRLMLQVAFSLDKSTRNSLIKKSVEYSNWFYVISLCILHKLHLYNFIIYNYKVLLRSHLKSLTRCSHS